MTHAVMKHLLGSISLLFSVSCTDTTSTNEPLQHTGSTQASSTPVPAGKLVFEQKCAACHGPDGTAGIAGAANLRQSKLDSLSTAIIIAQGKRAMPAFKNVLSTREINDITGYIITLKK